MKTSSWVLLIIGMIFVLLSHLPNNRTGAHSNSQNSEEISNPPWPLAWVDRGVNCLGLLRVLLGCVLGDGWLWRTQTNSGH